MLEDPCSSPGHHKTATGAGVYCFGELGGELCEGLAVVVAFLAGAFEFEVPVFFFAAGFFGGSVSSTIIFFGGGGGAALSVLTWARSRPSSSSFAPASFCIRSPMDRRATPADIGSKSKNGPCANSRTTAGEKATRTGRSPRRRSARAFETGHVITKALKVIFRSESAGRFDQ